MNKNTSIVVVGGGVVGLSVAWELSQRGYSVTLLDCNELGRKASWAGAGILAPANAATATQPMDKLLGLGSEIHERWHLKLQQWTGVDNGFRRCGGIYAARTSGDKAALAGQQFNWQEYKIDYSEIGLDHPVLRQLNFDDQWKLVEVPSESQICNPDHLAALILACELSGVDLVPFCGELEFTAAGARIESVSTSTRRIAMEHICFCSGAWTQKLLQRLDIRLPLIPVRGQMLLFKLEQPLFRSILNVGPRYVVPRDDGHVLVGSTMEEVGFNESTTKAGVEALQAFASELVPELLPERRVRAWAGLRPATHDGFPFIGGVHRFKNAFVATGHFRSGLQMSTATAVMMADCIEGRSTLMDIQAFAPSRLDFEESIDFSRAVNRR